MHYDNCKEMALDFSNLDTDARRVSSIRDPPGQRCVYIRPGPPERETYRLSTFKDFPTNVQVDPCKLAASGFYFTGYQDRVKCFSCGQAVDSWVIGDEPKSPNWHQPGCGIINGTDTTNVPILALVHQIRRNSGNALPAPPQRLQVAPPQPAFSQNPPRQLEAGSVLTTMQQNASRIPHVPPTIQTAQFTSTLPSLPSSFIAFSGTSNRSNNRSLFNTSGSQIQDLTTLFPCRNPINPHMRRMEARLQTFSDYAATWSSYTIRATPEAIADAGMYCLGERDRAKCWYCNGGLQNWDFDDDPWIEHAKYFPMCEYVLQRKGPEFVHSIIAQFPNLRRPTLYNPSTAESATHLASMVRFQPRPSRTSYVRNEANQVPEIVDPQEEMRKRNQKIEEVMESSDLVAEARAMEFDEGIIREVLKRKYESTNCGFQDLGRFVEDLLVLAGEGITNVHEEPSASSSSLPLSHHQSVVNTNLDEMRRLEESKLCKSCKKETSVMLFVPCGHLACCVECGLQVKKCPICNTLVRERIRTFLS